MVLSRPTDIARSSSTEPCKDRESAYPPTAAVHSGGLLAAVPEADVDDTVRALNAVGVQAWRVGRVEAADEPGVSLR